MSFIINEINLQIKWSERRILVAGTAANHVPEYKTTDTKLYVPVVAWSTQYNVKLL